METGPAGPTQVPESFFIVSLVPPENNYLKDSPSAWPFSSAHHRRLCQARQVPEITSGLLAGPLPDQGCHRRL